MILQSHPSDAAVWTVIAAPTCVLAIASADVARFDDLAGRMAEPDGFRAALETLLGGGIANAPSFALLDRDEAVLRVVLRGEASITVTSSQMDAAELTVSGVGMSTWAERVLEGVSSLRLEVPGSTWTLTIAGDIPSAEPVLSAPSLVEPVETPAPQFIAPELAPAENTLVPTSQIGVPPQVEPPVVEPVETSAPALAAPPIPAAHPTPAAAPIHAHAPEPESDDGYDFLFGNTIYRTQVGEIRIPNPDPERPGDHDGHTMLAEELGLKGHIPQTPIDDRPEHSAPSEATVLAPVGHLGSSMLGSPPPASPPVPPLQLAPTLQLERANGVRESLSQPVLIGRAPSASASASPAPRLITILDDKDISRSHVRIAVEGDAVVVTDLASKNGTIITLPGAGPRKLRAGEPTVVLPGTLIDLGGGVTFIVRED